jgi:hypothetical protein
MLPEDPVPAPGLPDDAVPDGAVPGEVVGDVGACPGAEAATAATSDPLTARADTAAVVAAGDAP